MIGPPGSSRYRRLIWTCMVVFGLAAGFGFYAHYSSQRGVLPLENDEWIRVVGVSVGTNAFRYDPPLYRIGRLIAPTRWKARIPDGITDTPGIRPRPAMVEPAKVLTVYFLASWRVLNRRTVVPIDSHGCMFYEASRGGGQQWGKQYLLSATMSAFPRRERKFKVALFREKECHGYLEVRNPLYAKFPNWEPETLPERSDREAKVTFRGFSWRPHKNAPLGAFLNATCTVEGLDSKWSGAKVYRRRFEDATGNRSEMPLCLRESAWRMSSQVIRTGLSNFNSGEKLSFEHMRVPANQEIVSVGQHQELKGMKLDVWALCGAGSFTITNGFREGIFSSETYPGHVAFDGQTVTDGEYKGSPGKETWIQKKPFMIFEAIGKADYEELQIYVRKEGAEEAQRVNPGLSIPTGARPQWNRLVHVVPLEFQEGADITIDIIVSRPKEFEFLVAPPEPLRN